MQTDLPSQRRLSIPSPDSTQRLIIEESEKRSDFQFLHRIPRYGDPRELPDTTFIFQFLHRIPQANSCPRSILHAFPSFNSFTGFHRTLPLGPGGVGEHLSIPSPDSTEAAATVLVEVFLTFIHFQFLHRIPHVQAGHQLERTVTPFNSFTGFHGGDTPCPQLPPR